MNTIIKHSAIISLLLFASPVAGQSTSGGAGGQDFVAKLTARLKQCDANNDGVIDADEVDKGGLRPYLELRVFQPAGVAPHYPIQVSEILKLAESKAGGGSPAAPTPPSEASAPKATASQPAPEGASSAPATSSSASTSSPAAAPSSTPASGGSAATASLTTSSTAKTSPLGPATASKEVVRRTINKSGKLATAAQLLPAGLPAWFIQKMDRDGQVTMSGYANRWTDTELKEFEKYDLNHDGIITAAEVLKVQKRGR